jgi:hypothetical protein
VLLLGLGEVRGGAGTAAARRPGIGSADVDRHPPAGRTFDAVLEQRRLLRAGRPFDRRASWHEVHGIDLIANHVQIHTTRGPAIVRVSQSDVDLEGRTRPQLLATLRRSAQLAVSEPYSGGAEPPGPPPVRRFDRVVPWLAMITSISLILMVLP